jgi:hypothetical protein
MGDGAQDSLGLFAWIYAEPAVDARHNEIKLIHHIIGII